MKGSPVPVLQRLNKLILVAGHGGNDPGACNGAYKESEQAIRIVNRIAELLTPHLPPGTVIKAPHGDDTHQSIPWLNEHYPAGAWGVEIHRDSGINAAAHPQAADLRCGIYHGHHRNSRDTADCMAHALRTAGAHSSTWMRDMSLSRFTSIGFIARPKILSHILECGFMEGSNADAHLDHLARIAAAALLYTFAGIALPPPDSGTPDN